MGIITKKITAFLMLVCFASFWIEPYKVEAAEIQYDKLDEYVDKEGLQKVYNELFDENLTKQDVKIVSKSEAENHPVAMVKLENGKVAYYVDGEPYYPLAVETGWWDTRVDDNGQMSSNPANVGDNFKEITDDEWNSYFSDMHNIGFNTVQLMTYWRDWEPVQGEYDFTFLNHVTDLAAANGLKTELIIFFHSQTDNIPREMDNFWGYHFDEHNIDGHDYALSMQWGNNFTSAADIRADRDQYGGSHAGIENFLEYWHPVVFEGIINALEALGRNFVSSSNVIGYQIGNEEGFNFYVDGGNDKNPYYKELKKMYEADPKNNGKDTNKFRAETVNNLWKCFNNALHKGDPYKPTTTNIQSGNTEKNNIKDTQYSNDGTTMDFYKSVDMIGSMFYGGAASIYSNLDSVYNTYKNGETDNTYATGFPILFPTEISGTMNDGSVAKQITAQTIARGGQGIGLYCYGELYNNFELNGTKYPKPVLGTIKTMLDVLENNKEIIHSGLPVTADMTTNIFMKIKEISNGQQNQGNPTLSVLEGINGEALSVLHFYGNANSGYGSAGSIERTVTVTFSAKEAGHYKVLLNKTDGSVDVKVVNVESANGEVEFTVDTTGLDVVYITAEKTDETEVIEPTLESIEIYGTPTKTKYKLYEDFNSTGVKIRAKYSNGTVKMLTDKDEVKFTGFDSEKVGEQTIKVEYEGKQATYKIIVEESDYYTNMREFGSNQVELLFDGKVNGGNSGSFKAEEDDLKKMAAGDAWIQYNFSEEVELSGINMWTNFGNDQGIKKFKVAIPDEKGNWTFIKDENGQEDKEFNLNWTTSKEECEKQGVEFEAVNTDKVRIYVLDAGHTWETGGIYKFAMREIEFNAKSIELTGIEVTKMPTKTVYEIGDTLDLSGMEVTAKYSNSTEKVIIEGYEVSGFNSDVIGEQIITVTYEEKSAEFKVIVKAVEENQDKPTIDSKPSDTNKPLGGNNGNSENNVINGNNNNNNNSSLPITGVTSAMAVGLLGTITSLVGVFMIKERRK